MTEDMVVFVKYIVFLCIAFCLRMSSEFGHAYAEKNVKDQSEKADIGVSTVEAGSLFSTDDESEHNGDHHYSDRTLPTTMLSTTTESQIPESVNHPTIDVSQSAEPVDHTTTYDNVAGFLTSAPPDDVSSASAFHSQEERNSKNSEDMNALTNKQLTSNPRRVNLPSTKLYTGIVSNLSKHHRKHYINLHTLQKSDQLKSIPSTKIDQNNTTNRSILSEAPHNMNTTAMNLDLQLHRAPYMAPNDGAIKRTFPSASEHRDKQFIVSKNLSHQRHSRFPGNYSHLNYSFRPGMNYDVTQKDAGINVFERFVSAFNRLSVSKQLLSITDIFNVNYVGNNKEIRLPYGRSLGKKHTANMIEMTEEDASYYDNKGWPLSDVSYIQSFFRHKSKLMSQNVSHYLAFCGQVARSATISMNIMKGLLNNVPGVDINTGDGKYRSRNTYENGWHLDHRMHVKKREHIITELLLLNSKCRHILRYGNLLTHGKDITSNKVRHKVIDAMFQIDTAEHRGLDKTSAMKSYGIVESETSAANNDQTIDMSDDMTLLPVTIQTDSTRTKQVAQNEVKIIDAVSKRIKTCRENGTNGRNCNNLRRSYSRMLAEFFPGRKRQNVHSRDVLDLFSNLRHLQELEVPQHNVEVVVDSNNSKEYGRQGETNTAFQMDERNDNVKYDIEHGITTDRSGDTDDAMETFKNPQKGDGSPGKFDRQGVSARNIQTRDAVILGEDQLNTKHQQKSTQKHRKQDGDTDQVKEQTDEEHTGQAGSDRNYRKFTGETRDIQGDSFMSDDFQNSNLHNKDEDNKITNRKNDGSKRNYLSASKQSVSHMLVDNVASETDNTAAESHASEVQPVSRQHYESIMNTDNDFDNFPQLGYDSLTRLEIHTYEDPRGGEGYSGEPSFRSFSRFHTTILAETLPAHGENVRINGADTGQYTTGNHKDLGSMPYNTIITMIDDNHRPATFERGDLVDGSDNGSPAGSGDKALPKRMKRSIALSFDKPSTESWLSSSLLPTSLSSSAKTTSSSSTSLSLLTSSPSSLDVINSQKRLYVEGNPVSSQLSTESTSLSTNSPTTSLLEHSVTELSPTSDMRQIVKTKPLVKIGVILAFDNRLPWVINKTRPAIEMAAETVRSVAGSLRGYDIQIVFRDSRCSDTFGSLEGIDLYVKKLAHVFIGPSCDYSIAPLARFSYYWGIPILTAGALVEAFANKAEYRLLTRIQGSYTKSAEFFVSIALTYGWSTIGLVYHEVKYDGRGSRSTCAFTIEPIFYSVEQFMKTKPWHVSFNEKEATDDTIVSVMKQVAANSRIVVLCASPNTVRDIMIKAHELNFDNGEYVFFNIDLFSSKNASETPWHRPEDTDERNAKARKAYESLMTVTLRMPTSTEYREFSNEVKARAAEMYPNFTYGEDEVNSFVGAFHDAVLLYALALNETLAENGSISDGEAITRRMWNRTFTGITGNVSIDPNGDRNADYSLLDLNPETNKFEVVANYFGNKRKYEPVPGKAIHWAGGRQGPPPDTPKCGFDGSKCPPDEPFPEYGIVIIVLGSTLLIVLFAVSLIYRHIKLEAELAEMNWRVRWDDILFGVLEKNKKLDRQGSRLSLGRSSVSTGCSGDTIAVHLNDARNRQLFTKTGYYKGAIIAIKPINRINITITKPMLLEIKRMKDLQNDHIVRFIGACIDCSNYCILTEYCPKGSLQDVLENEQIKLDWMFRYSIMQDIVRGMAYLQGTEIHAHGNLKSSNCVVDSRFVVKITDFGLHHLRGTASPSEEDKQKYSYYQSILWTAPELLRMAYRPPEGTIKGDVYSFAIICQEIVYRNGVFFLQNFDLSPQDICQKVKLGLKPYFRPTLEEYDCPCDELAGVIRRCWSEEPADRPDFQALKSIIRKLNRDGDKGNILDNLLSRMEQYANNLEALVEERTADYLQQKKKAEDLLYNMLPKKVASQLIRGESVTAEWYDNVSIYFSDICGFTALSAESTPMEVVDLLNDLYTTFDSIIENFDVYKVETIGDAYMVVSGLPDRNGNIHAREIARMSLSLQKATVTFRIRHKPNYHLKIRIGIHTGPVCAGVVGLKMPRYCLFGDTVNTASRMESNGLPLKIHVSPQCKEVLDYFGSFELELRGNVEMKGKGQVKTYWLLGEKQSSDSPGVTLNIL